MSSPEPQIDLTKIAFPTDHLTVKKLRELFPRDFDRANEYGIDCHTDGNWEAVLAFERRFAWQAFNAALGRAPERISPGNLEEERQMQRDAYVAFGLATGRHHAEQLIRTFEEAAAEQAKGYGLPPRS